MAIDTDHSFIYCIIYLFPINSNRFMLFLLYFKNSLNSSSRKNVSPSIKIPLKKQGVLLRGDVFYTPVCS